MKTDSKARTAWTGTARPAGLAADCSLLHARPAAATAAVWAPKATWITLLTALSLAGGLSQAANAPAVPPVLAAAASAGSAQAPGPASGPAGMQHGLQHGQQHGHQQGKQAGKQAATPAAQPLRTPADIIATAPASAWRDVDPDNLLIMTLPKGEALIELAPRFAPRHVDNIRALARGGYWDGLAVPRVQDNYVTQWGDPDADDEETGVKGRARPFPPGAAARLPAEFDVPLKGLPMTLLPDVDGWAPKTGHVDGFPAAADPRTGRAWMAHCYATVGAGRGNEADSSTGAELYVVIGHAPRGLDLNITVVGRVLKGMEVLSSLPRGTGRLGFYETPAERTAISRVVLASALAPDQRPQWQVLRTDTPTWQALLDARRHRGGWFVHSPRHTDVCTAVAPVRQRPTDVKLDRPPSPESSR